MISFDEANNIAGKVARGIGLLKSCIETEDLELLKEYLADDENGTFEARSRNAKRFAAIEILLEDVKEMS